MRMLIASFAGVVLTVLPLATGWAEHDIEFVAEHLPEVSMDNRYATLPIWAGRPNEAARWRLAMQAAYSATGVGSLSLEGPMLSLGLQRELTHGWQISGFGFFDQLSLRSGRDYRPLQTLFAPQTPFERPVDAMFTDLDGRDTHAGVGFAVGHGGRWAWLGEHRWVAGVIWERVALRNYSLDYELLAGPQTGLTGRIDFDNDYNHVTPFVGLELPRDFGQWTLGLHSLLAYPLPRRGFVGHISGPDFDIAGDTSDVGNGKHFGDPSLTVGLDITYRPAGLTFDMGTVISQWLLEPAIHRGIDRNVLLSVTWRPQ